MAAACGSLEHIFKKPLPENPTLIESLSTWNQIKPPTKPSLEDSSSSTTFTEIFGELHFKENPEPSSSNNKTLPFSSSSSSSSSPSSSSLSSLIYNEGSNKNTPPSSDFFLPTSCQRKQYSKNSTDQRFPSTMNSESLQLCTEGLGFESSDDVEELANGMNSDWQKKKNEEEIIRTSLIAKGKHVLPAENPSSEFIKRSFPPPISCIGKTGKPGVCFQPYRKNGRFVLKEIRIPTQEFLHACREDGRLKLKFFHSEEEDDGEEEEEEILDEEEEEDYEDDDDDDDESENYQR